MEKNTMGAFIAALRKSKGITQQELADMLNVSNKAVSRWERDETAPDVTLIPAIADIFGVTCDELLRGSRIRSEAENSGPDAVMNVGESDAKDNRYANNDSAYVSDKRLKSLMAKQFASFTRLYAIALAILLVGGGGGLVIYAATENYDKIWLIGIIISVVMALAALITFIIAFSRLAEFKHSEIFEQGDVKMTTAFRKKVFPLIFWVIWQVAWMAFLTILVGANGVTLLYGSALGIIVGLYACRAIGVKRYGAEFYKGIGKLDGEKPIKIMFFLQLAVICVTVVFELVEKIPQWITGHTPQGLGWMAPILTVLVVLFFGAALVTPLLIKIQDMPRATLNAACNIALFIGLVEVIDGFWVTQGSYWISTGGLFGRHLVYEIYKGGVRYDLVIFIESIIWGVIFAGLGIFGHYYMKRQQRKKSE